MINPKSNSPFRYKEQRSYVIVLHQCNIVRDLIRDVDNNRISNYTKR